ncbi:DUF3027 domain-containing protein [Arthrobacter sp. Leaf69]|uniref:DUF3027 domain-containing protein n=1 Tax=Arthrobacter sp. Leaf69 TaxID=1736232 RepID=UPI0007017D4E|nr:DUF3027 domain-containing protein [Arthrobacter sp. Leaf69]KQN94708.1 hypothetical protein ASE96_00430 [Arthrobacter sp. Leaf69]
MTPETDQTEPTAVGSSAAGDKAAAGNKKAGTKQGPKPRAGVPVWRTGKPDAFLAAAVDVARAAIKGIAPAEQIGPHLAAKSEGDRLVTHLFESKLPGYGGWQWYAVLTRNSRSKEVTVDELGLLPSEDSILAPEWIPWAERVRPGDEQGDEELQAAAGAAPQEGAGEAAAVAAATTDAEDAPEDDSDDADGKADGAGDEYDTDAPEDDDVDDAGTGDAPRDESPATEDD